MRRLFSLFCGIVLLRCLTGTAEEWPQFRGSDSRNVSTSTTLPTVWGPEKNLAWKVRIPGDGRSSPIVWGEKIFVTTAVEDQAPVVQGDRLRGGLYRWEVHCLNLTDGSTVWRSVATQGEPRIATHMQNGYASETPVTDGERVYAYFGMTGLFAYDFHGNVVWKKDFGAYAMQRNWGTSSSPLYYDHRLYLQIDSEETSFLVALDPKTGNEIWRVERSEKSNWSTPVIWNNSKRTELVTNGKTARSYDPKTGRILWELDIGGGRCSASPTADGDLLYLGSETRSSGGGFLFAVKAGAMGDITPQKKETTSNGVLWSKAKAGPPMASPLAYRGLVYIVKRNTGILVTYDAKTGNEMYKTRLSGAQSFWATPWAHSGKVYCLDDTGTVHVLMPGPAFERVAQNSLEGEFWSSPAMAHGVILLRSVDRLYCIRG